MATQTVQFVVLIQTQLSENVGMDINPDFPVGIQTILQEFVYF